MVADPAGKIRDPLEAIPIETHMTTRWGIEVRLPASNSPEVRIEAMKELCRRQNGLQLGSNISIIRKGFQGKYQYMRKAKADSSGNVTYRNEPDKNFYSHPMDAVCYVALDVTVAPDVLSPNTSNQNTGELVVV